MFNPIEFARAEEALLKLRAAELALTKSSTEFEQRMEELRRDHDTLIEEINAIISIAKDAYEKSLHDILHERNLNEDAVRALISQRTDALVLAGVASLEVPIEEIRPQRRPGPARGTKRRTRGETADTPAADSGSDEVNPVGEAADVAAHSELLGGDEQQPSNDSAGSVDGAYQESTHESLTRDNGGFEGSELLIDEDSETTQTSDDPFAGLAEAHLVTSGHSLGHDEQAADPLIASLLGTGAETTAADEVGPAIPGVPADDDEDWN
ncbi:hypothetical protein [Microvirga tunisiensis]|uniref:Uncharacterized protein n=1 Tax=Microvirga tunisiensis TaxID=2108360 RepID=A0A5N7MIQ8_9HYPH|nr:hypothetical protein [Microvirga tunisiensis]MPR05626.1 hypothetical protein [Microvirga tunisiensis]MPR23826.1 hypothetical protein [Microvirga tunisiensis]